MSTMITIEKINQKTIDEALLLVWNVFQEFEMPDYSQEGVEEFYKSIHNQSFLSQLSIYGAFAEDKGVGVIATRSEGTHIALFFVKRDYQKRGIGKQLFQRVRQECPSDKMTVNSSPFAVPIYHKLGFQDTDTEQMINGIKFTPMVLKV